MTYEVKLDQFEGPLDLLLHLISKSKIQIEDISIAEITQQYLQALQAMQRFDIEIASEFLVMASTLLHIKSSVLLPKPKIELEDEDSIETREDLIARLIEYKKYKEASEQLQKRESYYSTVFSKLPEEIFTNTDDVLPPDISTDNLYMALYKLLNNKRERVEVEPIIHEIRRDPKTINQRIKELKRIFKAKPRTSFFNLFKEDRNKNEIIVTFLALLELLKDNIVELKQVKPFQDIVIKRRDSNG